MITYEDVGQMEAEGFRIENDKMAEWALSKIRDAREDIKKWEGFYNWKLEQARKESQNTIDYMTHLLRQYFDTQQRKVTKTGIEKYSLPSGELIRKPAGLDYKRDDTALLAWCEEHLPEAVKVTRKAGWAEVKAYIKATGEIPDGVEPYETEPVFTVKEAE